MFIEHGNKLSKIKSKLKQVEIYKVLRILLQEQNNNFFDIIFHNTVHFISSNEKLVDFTNYFIGSYTNYVHARINTNIHVERMYHTLKHI